MRIHVMKTVAAVSLLLLWGSPASADCRNRADFGTGSQLAVLALTTDQRLVRFRECQPDRFSLIDTVSGLSGSDTSLVGIDFRVQDGRLYGVGNGGGIYVIDTDTATALLVSQLTVALSGTMFGVDFNPAADRLRIVSDTGQNLRHNLNAGGTTIMDLALNYTPATPAAGITAVAYTNNDLDPNTGTTLFDVDTTLNQVAIQSPPNNGSLVAVGQLTVDADSPAGFDIFTDLRNGVAGGQRGFASLVTAGVSGFYYIDLLTGRATLVGGFDDPVIDVAVPLAQ
jgi:hypothetical protein